jgi:hypothetical protein
MTQETLVKMIIALVLLAILLFLAYKYILKGGENAAKLGDCETKPGQTCMSKNDIDGGSCKSGQSFKFGCPGDPNLNADDKNNELYCCVVSQ